MSVGREKQKKKKRFPNRQASGPVIDPETNSEKTYTKKQTIRYMQTIIKIILKLGVSTSVLISGRAPKRF